jgi:hypothetical protein
MINLNPIMPVAGVPPGLIQTLNDRFREIQLNQAPAATTPPPAAAPAPASGLFQRTLLLKDTTVGNDIADHVTCFGPIPGVAHTAVLVTGVLRLAIAADLTVRINNVSPGGTVEVGTWTIPAATPIDTPQLSTTFVTSSLPDMSVFTWDVLASDGSKDPAGVASCTIEWQP